MVFPEFVRTSLVSAVVQLCVSQHNHMFRRSWHSREWLISGCNRERGVTELGEAECKGLGKMNQTSQENASKLSCEIPRWQRGSAVGHVQAVFLRSVAALWPLYQQEPRCVFQPFEKHVLLQRKVCSGKPWKQHSVVLASAIVHRSCPRGPSAEWFTSVAQKTLLFRVLLLQIVFSSVG